MSRRRSRQQDVVDMVAHAIKRADRTYFFENYTKQAESVMDTLTKAGLVIVPAQPNAVMLETGKDRLVYGPQRPEELLTVVFAAMIESGVTGTALPKPEPLKNMPPKTVFGGGKRR